MARNKVMTLWTTVVTAFLALFTALGLITTSAAAAVPRTETARNSESTPQRTAAPAPAPWSWSRTGSLPPTMKQRIHAEAHGKSPSCRHRPLTDATAADPAGAATPDHCRTANGSAGHRTPADPPLQR
ncbi:DUF6344 domain-containing protein [Streptomyces fumanus]|uniref:DUF6344 domain-containing protein n=1 Tax=Streptomyces fumanus TaxID=67302 RepID=UPI0033C0A265